MLRLARESVVLWPKRRNRTSYAYHRERKNNYWAGMRVSLLTDNNGKLKLKIEGRRGKSFCGFYHFLMSFPRKLWSWHKFFLRTQHGITLLRTERTIGALSIATFGVAGKIPAFPSLTKNDFFPLRNARTHRHSLESWLVATALFSPPPPLSFLPVFFCRTWF